MTRETTETKARRYLAAGRVTVTRVDGDLADAVVQGDHGVYQTTHGPEGWRCTCPAGGRCSHATALRMITTASRPIGDPAA